MEWKLFADLAEIADSKTVPVDVEPGATVGEALDRLFDRHPELRDRVMKEDGSIETHINVLRNGMNIETEENGLDTVLNADDELAIFPPVSGGSRLHHQNR